MTTLRSPYPDVTIPDVSLSQFVIGTLGARGDHPTLIDGLSGVVTTARQLAGRVRAGAAALESLGVGVGDVVALMTPNQPGFVTAFHAAVATGAAVTPLNPLLTEEEISRQLADSRTKVLLVDEASVDKARAAATSAGVAHTGTLEPDWPGTCATDEEGAWPELEPASALAALPYSSGTTGTPKGVMLTHRNLVANLAQFVPMWRYGEDDVVCAVLPFFHIYGLTVIMNLSLLCGPTIVTLPRFSPITYLETIERYRVTRLHLAPPMVLQLVNCEQADRFDTSSVRWAVSGAAPLDVELAERFEARFGVRVVQGYGMTEASPGTHLIPEREPDLPVGSVGRLMPMTEARLVPVETTGAGGETEGVESEDGELEGEIWIRGPQVMAGYLGNPEATAETLTEDGWLRTGDVARVRDGVFFIVDRVKELIKYKGYQVAPAELEALLLTHRDVVDAAVVGVYDEAGGEAPKAFVVAARPIDPDALMEWVGSRVAPYKRIRSVEFIDAIPKSPSGKILRRLLIERERAASEKMIDQ